MYDSVYWLCTVHQDIKLHLLTLIEISLTLGDSVDRLIHLLCDFLYNNVSNEGFYKTMRTDNLNTGLKLIL